MREISINDFRQQCVSLMGELPPDGILITQHGLPVAKVVPVVAGSCAELIGTMPILYDNDDDLFGTGERCAAVS